MLIQTITNAVAGEFDFDTIADVFSRLIIKGRVRSSVSATSDSAYLFLNNDTTVTNYHRQRIAANNGALAVTESADPAIFITPGASSPAGAYASVHVVIEGYGSSVYIKTAFSRAEAYLSSGAIFTGTIAVANSSITAVITRLRFQADSHPTDGLLGTLRLYGES